MNRYIKTAAVVALAIPAVPAAAQQQGEPGVTAEGPPETVFDGDFLTVGVGVAYGPSYSGSDDYTAFVLPIVQGSVGGVDISPRPGGLALDLIPDAQDGPSFSAGPSVRLRSDRTDIDDIEDEIVAAYGALDTAVEVGASLGVSFPKLLNPFDSLSANVDIAWDVAGAHGGMTVSPSISYFTPLSRAMAASLSVSTTYISDDFADYYYSVPAANSALPPASLLPEFRAEGGFEKAGVNLLLAYDLSGDVTDGGLSLIGLGGYSHLLGDAEDSPFTRLRGEADQWLVAVGIGYTF
ncbi:MipA/OmpV family protein [Qipengyuania sp.]|uniref:MipA/OmpV family protein n=1 Tax=Qipengyuania sp. TaxID=2004515 RepID=UPI00373535D6